MLRRNTLRSTRTWVIIAIIGLVGCGAGQDAVPLTDVTAESELESGIYSVDPDGSSTTPLVAEFTIDEPGWFPLMGPVRDADGAGGYMGIKFLSITDVASTACDGTVWEPVDSADQMAMALGAIGDFVTLEEPTAVNAYGYDGYHLVLEVPDIGFEQGDFIGCDDGYFDGYEGPAWSRYFQAPGQLVELWALDVDGTSLMIEVVRPADSPEEATDEIQAILDTVQIRP